MALTSPPAATNSVATVIPLGIPALPTEPFGSLDLPQVGQPVTEWGIQQAHLRLLAHYQVPASAAERTLAQRPLGNQLDKALTIALDPTRWTLHDDHVEIIGSHGDRYRVTPAFCEGSAWPAKGGRRSTICKGSLRAAVGMCAHQLAVEYLRLAQLLDPPIVALTDADPPMPTLTQIACVDLPGFVLFSLLGYLNVMQMKVAAEQVDILISGGDDNFVCVSSGLYHAQAPASPAGGAYIALEPDAFAILWKAVCSEGMKTPTLTLTVTLDEQQNGALTVASCNINITVSIQGSAY